jgi:hypothetical protein
MWSSLVSNSRLSTTRSQVRSKSLSFADRRVGLGEQAAG